MNEKLEKAIDEIAKEIESRPKREDPTLGWPKEQVLVNADNWQLCLNVISCLMLGYIVQKTGVLWSIKYDADTCIIPPWFFVFSLECGDGWWTTSCLEWTEVDSFDKIKKIADEILECKRYGDSLD